MRVLVIPEKAATPKIHQYKFQKNCRLEVGPFGWSNATLPRFGSTRLLSRQAIYKQNQWETFHLSGPLDLVGLACGMVAARKMVANWPLPDDRLLNASRFRADEDNLELLLDDDLIVDAR